MEEIRGSWEEIFLPILTNLMWGRKASNSDAKDDNF
jgi:hypothetical protein